MSVKNRDMKNRRRSKTVGFRMSPEEATQLNTLARLSGLSKQDYIIAKVLDREVIIHPNPRVYKALKTELQELCLALKGLCELNGDHEELLDLTRYMLKLLSDVKGETNEFGQEKSN